MISKNGDPLATAAQGLASFVNRIVIDHPCMVLRRQCQVHQFAKRKHLTPFTLVPAVGHIISKDGVITLWKGSIGCGVLWALKQVAEIVISDLFSLPKTIIPDGSSERFWRHILLKAGTYFVMTPFIVASFVETVRSNTGFSTAEDARILDVIVRGIDRLRFDLFGAKDSSRRFSIAHLSVPTVGYFTTHYLIGKFTYDTVYGMARRYVSRKMPQDRTRFHSIMPEMFAGITSHMIADLLCYPMETILHRMYIQGTRTLIDNLDTGTSAISISVKYNGLFHCFNSIMTREGLSGLFMGVGAVILQYSLQFAVLNIVRAVFNHGTRMALHVNTSPRGAVAAHGFHSPPSMSMAGGGPFGGSTTPPAVDNASLFGVGPGGGCGGPFDASTTTTPAAWNAGAASGRLSPIFSAATTSANAFSAGYFGDTTNNAAAFNDPSPNNYSYLLLRPCDGSDSIASLNSKMAM